MSPPRGPVCNGALGAFRIPEFRTFFGGSIAASLGMWMQVVAQGWLVVTLTDSEFLIGLVSFCALIPFLLFSLFGGILADRLDKRHVLMGAQLLSAGLTVGLGTLILTGQVRLWHLMFGLFCTGSIAALSVPSLEAIMPEIVGKRNLLNGIALKSAQFYLAGVIGPTLGGFLTTYL
ncbi:MAG: MFS transporter, partial [Chloroflexota bacterium]|nr:MFS transporter [Chloroflexota bacterium]